MSAKMITLEQRLSPKKGSLFYKAKNMLRSKSPGTSNNGIEVFEVEAGELLTHQALQLHSQGHIALNF